MLINRSAQTEAAKANFILTFFQATRLISQLMQKSFNLLKSRKLQENQLTPMGIMSSKPPEMEEFQNIPKDTGKELFDQLPCQDYFPSELQQTASIQSVHPSVHRTQSPQKTCRRREPVNSVVSLLPWNNHTAIRSPLLVQCIIIVIFLLEMTDFYQPWLLLPWKRSVSPQGGPARSLREIAWESYPFVSWPLNKIMSVC